MAGRPLKPQAQRRNSHPPALGEWQAAAAIGWQHGAIPEPPDGLVAASREAWTVWFRAWFASHWTPADLPGLRLVIHQFDAIQRGGTKANDMTALVRLLDTYGITPAGQQSRRWSAPDGEIETPAAAAPASRYASLRVVNE